MNIIATDDEKLALEGLVNAIKEAEPAAQINGFHRAKEALSYAESHACDIAFLDIEMRDMNGLELAKRLKGFYPRINIVFVTGYTNYAGDALSLYVSGYVTKPATKEKIQREIQNLRHPIEIAPSNYIKVQTFGNFEVFVDNVPVNFKYTKTKELLAFLVDRKGALCTTGEIMSVLWEDAAAKKRSYYSNLIVDLVSTMAALGYEDVIVKRRGKLGIVPQKIVCDCYDWNKGIAYAVNAYQGEYMSQYSWAETTLGEIEQSLR